jgi:UDP-N-acetylmuramoyl-L-alanyl-D-glutamate--2,6-diaminopimelate ligase
MIDSPLVGEFNAENLLLALGALIAWDLPFAEACAALERCLGLPGRMEVLGGGPAAPWVVVDYAHTPAALERVLRDLRGLGDGELWCVFGCGGDRDAGKRAPMGAAAARLADHVVLTDDNPRGEDPGAIVADIRVGLSGHPDVRLEHERGKAISAAVARAGVGDVVLVAGKGHESWQWIGTERRAFSDRAAVQAALEARA